MTIDIQKLIEQSATEAPITSAAVIYGAGRKGQEVCRALIGAGYAVHGFLDAAAQPGQRWQGLPILSPQNPCLFSDLAHLTCVVAIHNPAVSTVPIFEMLKRLGFGRILSLVELYNLFPDYLTRHYWLINTSFYGAFSGAIDFTCRLWADALSAQWFRAALNFRMTGDPRHLPEPSIGDQYRPAGLTPWQEPLRMIDCGSFDGDTINDLLSAGYFFDEIAAFEPDASNFRRLTARLGGLPISRVTAFPCGVGATTEMVSFSGNQGASSCADKSGTTFVQCVALDDVLSGFCPNLIKMDVEGSELDALLGAQQLINKYRPSLAISVYHHPAHFWQIPMLIHSLDLGYRLFLRAHAENTFDIVMYALPDK